MIWLTFFLTAFARLIPSFEICFYETLELPHKTEPSDLLYAHNKLFMVSDNGHLIVFDNNLQLSLEIEIDGHPDLEGLASDPHDPDILFLGQGDSALV